MSVGWSFELKVYILYSSPTGDDISKQLERIP